MTLFVLPREVQVQTSPTEHRHDVARDVSTVARPPGSVGYLLRRSRRPGGVVLGRADVSRDVQVVARSAGPLLRCGRPAPSPSRGCRTW